MFHRGWSYMNSRLTSCMSNSTSIVTYIRRFFSTISTLLVQMYNFGVRNRQEGGYCVLNDEQNTERFSEILVDHPQTQK